MFNKNRLQGLVRDMIDEQGPRRFRQRKIKRNLKGHVERLEDRTLLTSTLFFTANDGTHGIELFKSDGTSAGTALVDDINPGSSGSNPKGLVNLNGTLYFTASDGTHNNALWKSNGTSTGTSMVSSVVVADINTGLANPLVVVGTTLYFGANGGPQGEELWKSDGTSSGTVLVKDIWPGTLGMGGRGSSTPGDLTNVNGTLFFAAREDTHGMELWKSDGTSSGTVLVDDINPTNDSLGGGTSDGFTPIGSELYFGANDGTHGKELWKSNGTSSGTVLVKDLNPGSGNGLITTAPSPINVNGTLFFTDPSDDLYKSDGTSAGTVLVKTDVVQGGVAIGSPGWTNNNGVLFFQGSDSSTGIQLWKSDGTSSGTVLVKVIDPVSPSFPGDFVTMGGTVYFSASDYANGGAYNQELWKSDGTSGGTSKVKDINVNGANAGSFPSDLTVYNSKLYFAAKSNDPVTGNYGRELWASDGTTAGTSQVKDINPLSAGSFGDPGSTLYPAPPNNFFAVVTTASPSGTLGLSPPLASAGGSPSEIRGPVPVLAGLYSSGADNFTPGGQASADLIAALAPFQQQVGPVSTPGSALVTTTRRKTDLVGLGDTGLS